MNAVTGSFGVDILVSVPESYEVAKKVSMINISIVIFLENSKGTDEVTEEIGLGHDNYREVVFQKGFSKILQVGKDPNLDLSVVV